MQARGGFNSSVSPQELEEMARTVLMFCLKYYNGDEKIKVFFFLQFLFLINLLIFFCKIA